MAHETAEQWIDNTIPDLEGMTAVVTGANSGVGREVAWGLARSGARVILACRNVTQGLQAAEAISHETGNDSLKVQELDLASRASITNAAKEIQWNHPSIDILVNNAGVGLLKRPTFAAEGFEHNEQPVEMHFAVNYIGHYALTGMLMPSLANAPAARVVNVSSNGHKTVGNRLGDINWNLQSYSRTAAYNHSKLAQLAGTFALERRLKAIGSPVKAVAAHPGIAMTNFFRHTPMFANRRVHTILQAARVAQSPAMGALPVLFAAAGEGVRGGDYYGPDSPLELTGLPKKVDASKVACDKGFQDQLWTLSEEITDIRYF